MEQMIIKQEIDDSVRETETGDNTEIKYEEKLKYTSLIAKPMAPKKLTKKIYKCIKKGIFIKQLNSKTFLWSMYIYDL